MNKGVIGPSKNDLSEHFSNRYPEAGPAPMPLRTPRAGTTAPARRAGRPALMFFGTPMPWLPRAQAPNDPRRHSPKSIPN